MRTTRTIESTSQSQKAIGSGWRRHVFLVSLSISSILVSVLVLRFAPAPIFWFLITWGVVLWLAMLGVRGSWPRAILFNLGFIVCAFASVEAYFVTHEYTGSVISDRFYVQDDVLGWAPIKGIQVRAVKPNAQGLFHHPSGSLFDVKYTIDTDGLRVTPASPEEARASTVLFFGCSFTFGEGLPDDQTLPYQVGIQSSGRYKIYNFGVGGYGSEQMLAALESGMVSHIVGESPQYAYYVALPVHVWRVAGKVAWGQHSPRYVIGADGTPHRDGHFETRERLERRLKLNPHIAGQLTKSATWRTLTMGDSPIDDNDIRLYFATVARSRDLLKAQFPNIQFRIILYPNQAGGQQRTTYEKLRAGFARMQIPVDLVEDILPNYIVDRSPYVLSPLDTHPNAHANVVIADYVVNELNAQSASATAKTSHAAGNE
jgi:hypothetical protein